MAVPTIRLSDSQVEDVAVVCGVGADGLIRLQQEIDRDGGTVRPAKIVEIIKRQVGSDKAQSFRRVLFSFVTIGRRGFIPVSDVLIGVGDALSKKWDNGQLQKWRDCQTGLLGLLSSKSLSLATKARDLSFDFEKVCLAARILTDIRPVFDDERNKIVGAEITQTLRIEYSSPEGDHENISMALDARDIERLKTSCEQAIRKADAARALVSDKVETIMPGEGTE